MSKNSSIITGKLRGALGKELVFRDWDGENIVARMPKKTGAEPSESQLKIRENFLLASQYAKRILQDPDMAAAYERARRPRQNLYGRALEDCVNPPRVVSINSRNYTGIVGDQVSARAIDDFRVTGVMVQIFAADGTLLEQGSGVLALNGMDWVYTATQPNGALTGSIIKAIATDVPGNEGSLELIL